jgi:putative Mg2+ transporter-C (MgtC) family protein
MSELLLLSTATAAWPDLVEVQLLGRLTLAALLGGVVGLERELSGKPAGLRTNLLICVGAALLMELSIGVAALANIENTALGSPFRADPARIAAQIVSGIGFLGAGTILQSRGNVVGLTTAATIWVVAAIGMAVGAQAYLVAVGATILVVGCLMLLGRLEAVLVGRSRRQRYLVTILPDPTLLRTVEDAFREAGLRVETESVEKSETHYEVSFDISGPASVHARVLQGMIERDGVQRMTRIL